MRKFTKKFQSQKKKKRAGLIELFKMRILGGDVNLYFSARNEKGRKALRLIDRIREVGIPVNYIPSSEARIPIIYFGYQLIEGLVEITDFITETEWLNKNRIREAVN